MLRGKIFGIFAKATTSKEAVADLDTRAFFQKVLSFFPLSKFPD
jgi:hypothetical protein